MSIFKKEKIYIPSLAVITVPNIILLVLFFFVMSSNMHDVQMKSQFQGQYISSINRLERKSLVSHICILTKSSPSGITLNEILLNDAYTDVSGIKEYFLKEESTLNATDKKKMLIVLNIDNNAHMGIISDIKQALQSAGITHIIYNTTK
jgi:hypothetical protein